MRNVITQSAVLFNLKTKRREQKQIHSLITGMHLIWSISSQPSSKTVWNRIQFAGYFFLEFRFVFCMQIPWFPTQILWSKVLKFKRNMFINCFEEIHWLNLFLCVTPVVYCHMTWNLKLGLVHRMICVQFLIKITFKKSNSLYCLSNG